MKKDESSYNDIARARPEQHNLQPEKSGKAKTSMTHLGGRPVARSYLFSVVQVVTPV